MKLDLQKKLLGGFSFVAMLCAVVGLVGWYGTGQLKKSIEDVGGQSLPAMESILSLKGVQSTVKAAERTLLNPALPLHKRAEEYGKAQAAFVRADALIQTYDALEHTAQERATWQNFMKGWQQWHADVENFFALSQKIDALQIENPQRLALELEHEFSNYKGWAAGAAKTVLEQSEFDGNLDYNNAPFVLWLNALRVANPDVKDAVEKLQFQIKDAYRAVGTISDYIYIEEYELARDEYILEVLPSLEGIQIYVDNLMRPIATALELYGQLSAFEQEVTAKSLAQSEQQLEAIVQSTNSEVADNVRSGQQLAGTISTFVLFTIVVGVAAALIIGVLIARHIAHPLRRTVSMIEQLEKGHLDDRLNMQRTDEIGQMAQAMDAFADNLQHEVVAALHKLAGGDLSFDVVPRDQQDLLRGSLQTLSSDLGDLVSEIRSAGNQIAGGSAQISESSQSLSQGATESASSLEQISSSMAQLASQTQLNAENAAQANQLANEAKKSAEQGNRQMDQMVGAMEEISASAGNISKIIKVIDEIAFQTNLLALNAAVEAARAGQHGKGFAVVAEEVRNLAARSAKAASETATLIEGSVKKTETGAQIATQTADALSEIVTGVTKVTDLVAEIASASNEQAQGIGQVNQGLGQVDEVTQQNTASAEESASAAEELSGQAAYMQQMLGRFTLKTSQQATLASPPPSPAATSSATAAAPSESTWGAPGKPALAPAGMIALDEEEFEQF